MKRKLKKIRDMPVKVIPVAVGALEMTPEKLKQRLSEIAENYHLISARILRNVLEVWGMLLARNLKKINHWFKTHSVCNSNIIIIIIIIIIIVIIISKEVIERVESMKLKEQIQDIRQFLKYHNIVTYTIYWSTWKIIPHFHLWSLFCQITLTELIFAKKKRF